MTQYHARGLRKKSGGMRRAFHKKKKYELGGAWVETKLGEDSRKTYRIRAGASKTKLYVGKFVNAIVGGKTQKLEVKGILEHPDNPHYVRRSLITKGCVVQTDAGKVRITSRPGQSGVLNGRVI